jgi:hypothetical protein
VLKAERLTNRLFWNVLPVVLLIPLIIYASAVIHIRYMADDYCWSVDVRNLGIAGNVLQNYEGWTGIFSTASILSAFVWLGVQPAPLVGLMALVIFWLEVFVLCRLIVNQLFPGVEHPVALTASISSLICIALTNGLPIRVQSIYWTSGKVVYFLPLLVLMLFVFLMRQVNARSLAPYVLTVVTAFVLPGFAIAYVPVLLAMNLLAIVSFWRTVYRPHLIVGLIVMFISTVIVLAAPGNAVRQSHFPEPNLFSAIAATFTSPGAPFVTALIVSPVSTAGIGFLAFVAGRKNRGRAIPKPHLFILGIPVVVGLLVASAFFPAFYATGGNLPGRAWVLPLLITLLGLVAWCYVVGASTGPEKRARHSSWLQVGGVAVLIAIVLSSTVLALDTYNSLRAYALGWDQRDEMLRQALPGSSVTVPSLDVFRLEDLTTDSEFWVNRCVAEYYGLEQVIGDRPPPNSAEQ